MAHVTKRKTSKGELRFELRFRDPAGKERSRTFTTRRLADAEKRKVEAALYGGVWIDPDRSRVTLAEYAADWLDHRPKPLRPRTRDTYKTLLRLHVEPTLGSLELGKITPSVVRRWHAKLASDGPGATTAAKSYRLLHAILATAVSDEVIVRNPCLIPSAGVERAAERPVATIDQVWAAAEGIPDRYRCAVLLAGFVGLRRGEVLGLECRHLNLLHGTLTVQQQQQELPNGGILLCEPKTDAGVRTVALPSFLVSELEGHLARFADPDGCGRVFVGEKGGPLRALTLHKHWSRARKLAGLPDGFRFHDLRHTANTITAASGASTRELMHRMGHASSAAALRYQHATKERDVALAQALDDLASRRPATAKPAAEGGA